MFVTAAIHVHYIHEYTRLKTRIKRRKKTRKKINSEPNVTWLSWRMCRTDTACFSVCRLTYRTDLQRQQIFVRPSVTRKNNTELSWVNSWFQYKSYRLSIKWFIDRTWQKYCGGLTDSRQEQLKIGLKLLVYVMKILFYPSFSWPLATRFTPPPKLKSWLRPHWISLKTVGYK